MKEKKEKRIIEIPVNGDESTGPGNAKVDEDEIREAGMREEKSDNRIREAEEKALEYLDQLKRLQAEFSNYRKRMEKEKEGLRDWLHGQMLLDLLPVLDDMERLLKSHEGDKQIDIDGVGLIYQKFQKALKDRGLQEIDAMGQEFNPEMHEAVGVEITHPDKAGMVLEEWQKGYKIGERLLRPSRVKVGKTEEKAGDDTQ
jgi:molecular chaperone GrpE